MSESPILFFAWPLSAWAAASASRFLFHKFQLSPWQFILLLIPQTFFLFSAGAIWVLEWSVQASLIGAGIAALISAISAYRYARTVEKPVARDEP